MKWNRKSSAEAKEAIGDVSGLSVEQQSALTHHIDAAFPAIPRVRAGDWLSEHADRGQKYSQFLRVQLCGRPHSTYNTLYVVPFGEFDPVCAPDLNILARYATAFFGCNVKVTEPVPLSAVSSRARKGDEGQNQLHAGDILDHLAKMHLPRDNFCRVGVTMVDIFPRESWNYVFGLARASDATGVYSFSRYDPDESFFSKSTRRKLTDDEASKLLHRCVKVFMHETAHILGMKHCVYHACLMQGSNHLAESDGKPIYLCPVCLRKLHYATGVPLLARYRQLAGVCDDLGWKSDAAWFGGRADVIGAAVEEAGETPAEAVAPPGPSRTSSSRVSRGRVRRVGEPSGTTSSRLSVLARPTRARSCSRGPTAGAGRAPAPRPFLP